MIYIKDNKNILNTTVNNKIRLQYRLLQEINLEGIEDKILNYKNYVNDFTVNYKVDGEKKKREIKLINTTDLQSKFKELDKLGINIKAFIKYLIEHDYTKKSVLEKEDHDIKEYDFTIPDNQYITLEDLKSENKLCKTYKAFISQVTFNTAKADIISFKNTILEEIKKLTIDNKLILYGETYKPNHIQVRIDLDNTSKQLKLILDLYKKLIFYTKSKIIDDVLRFKLLKSFYEIMFHKKNVVFTEIQSLNYKIDDNYHTNFEDYLNYINKTFDRKESNLNQHCRMINYIENDKLYYDITNFSYISISNYKDEIKGYYVALPNNLKYSSYQTGYIYKNHISEKQIDYFNNDKKISLDDYSELKKNNPDDESIYTKIKDTKLLNIFSDTETDSKFFKIVDDKHITITKAEYVILLNENVDYIKNLDEATKNKIKNCEDSILNKMSLIDFLVKHKIYLKTELRIIQAYFHNQNTNESIINIWIDESKKEYYNNDTLEYTFKQKLKDKSIVNHTVKANIIYTKTLTTDYMLYIMNWYNCNIDKNTNYCPQLTIWFHNLKFDMLSTGILDNFENYNLKLCNFNDSTPRFYMFESIEEIEMYTKSVKPKILFLDSFNFSATSLKEMGKNVGIDKEVEKVNFNLNDNIFENVEKTKKLLEYSLMDVVILKEFVCSLKAEILKFTPIKYGSAGTALSCFLTSFYDDSFWYKNKNDNTIITDRQYKNLPENKKFNYIRDNNRIHKHRNKWLETIELYSYIGGHTEVFNKIGLLKNIISLDVNSSYPSSMLQKLPKKFMYSLVSPSLKEFKKIFADNSIYVIAKVFIKYDNNFIVPVKHDNQIEYPILNNFTTWLHEAELKYLLENNADVEIKELLCYSATNKIFENYVCEWMFKKSYNKREDINNPLMVSLSKLFANSCYGKLGEKTRISECRRLTKDDIELFKILLNNRDNCKYTNDELLSYRGYIDVPINTYFDSSIDCILNNPTFIELSEYTSIMDMSTIRVNFLKGFMSYSKKITIAGKNSSFALVGAITSYSRVALLKCLKLLGNKNNAYCDTDSNYTKKTKEQMSNINEIKPTKEDLLYMYTSKKAYKEILEKYEAMVKQDKINICKSLVSKYYFWEYENNGEPYHIITRGNKDNIKMFDLDKKQIFIEGINGSYDDFLKSDYKYIIKSMNLEKINTCLKGNKYFCKLSEKLKGVPKKLLCENEDLYFFENWLSPNMQKQLFNTLDGQYISYTLKTQDNSRSNYPKAECIINKNTDKKKLIEMVHITPIIIDFETIKNKFELSNVLTYSYYDYKIKPYEIIQVNEYIYHKGQEPKESGVI
jgi:hypothetical protein